MSSVTRVNKDKPQAKGSRGDKDAAAPSSAPARSSSSSRAPGGALTPLDEQWWTARRFALLMVILTVTSAYLAWASYPDTDPLNIHGNEGKWKLEAMADGEQEVEEAEAGEQGEGKTGTPVRRFPLPESEQQAAVGGKARADDTPFDHLPQVTAVLDQVTWRLCNEGNVPIPRILALQGGLHKEFNAAMLRLHKAKYLKIIPSDNGLVRLNAAGRAAHCQVPAIGAQAIRELVNTTCTACKGKGYSLPLKTGGRSTAHDHEQELDFMRKYKTVGEPGVAYDSGIWEGPEWTVEEAVVDTSGMDFDQGNMWAEDVALRLQFMNDRGDLKDKSLVLIGDDDLFSLAAALTGLPTKVTVLEIDDRLVKFINRVAKDRGLPVQAFNMDLQKVPPKEYIGAFDVFVGDPVETYLGLKMFLSRGAILLRPEAGVAGYFGITTVESSVTKYHHITRLLTDMHWTVTDVRRLFTDYPCTDTDTEDIQMLQMIEKDTDGSSKFTNCTFDWYKSSVFRMEAAEALKPEFTAADESAYQGIDLICDDESYCDDDSYKLHKRLLETLNDKFRLPDVYQLSKEDRDTATPANGIPPRYDIGLGTNDAKGSVFTTYDPENGGTVSRRARFQIVDSLCALGGTASIGQLLERFDGLLVMLQSAIARMQADGDVSIAPGTFDVTLDTTRNACPKDASKPEANFLAHGRCPVCGGTGFHAHSDDPTTFAAQLRGSLDDVVEDQVRRRPVEQDVVDRADAAGGKTAAGLVAWADAENRWAWRKHPKIPINDEGNMYPESNVERLAFMLERGDLRGKRILLLGDDDFLSLAIAKTGVAEYVAVLDLDERIIGLCQAAGVVAQVYDVTEPLPGDFAGAFDVVIMEPETTIVAAMLWMSRGVQALRGPRSALYYGVASIELSPRKLLAVERLALDMNFALTDLLRDFSTYPCDDPQDVNDIQVTTKAKGAVYGACDVDWYKTSLHRFELIGAPRPVIVDAYEGPADAISCDAEAYCAGQNEGVQDALKRTATEELGEDGLEALWETVKTRTSRYAIFKERVMDAMVDTYESDQARALEDAAKKRRKAAGKKGKKSKKKGKKKK